MMATNIKAELKKKLEVMMKTNYSISMNSTMSKTIIRTKMTTRNLASTA